MATIKGVIILKDKRQNGTVQAKIRLTHLRKTKIIATPIIFYPDQLTKSGKPKNCTPKFQLDEIEREFTEKLATLGMRVDSMSLEELAYYLTQKQQTDRIDFLKFWQSEVLNMANKGSAGLYQTALNNLSAFCSGKLFIDEVDFNFLTRYSQNIAKNTQGRAVSLYLGYLRAMYNRAKNQFNDEDMGVVRIPRNPFAKFKIPKQELTRKRALPIETIKQIRDLEDNGIRWNLARDVFMLSFYFMGMNTADMFDCEPSKDGRIEYERTKTKTRRKDKAFISVKIQTEAKPLLVKYKTTDKTLLFRFSKMYATARDFNKAVNLGLKQIGTQLKIDDLEFYAARHSWATIATKQGVNKYIVHECLNHVIPEMKVTDTYIEKDWSILDKANRKVLDAIKSI